MITSWIMPAEWETHARTWMAWPCNSGPFGDAGVEPARAAFAEVARAIAQFEPVTMIANSASLPQASKLCNHSNIEILDMALDDSWMRDIGPTFVRGLDGRIAGVDWRFNGWGEVYGSYDADAAVAEKILQHLGIVRLQSPLTTEGGSIHSDGNGNVIVCETAMLDPARNPGWSKSDIERELAKQLGAQRVCWLAGGLEDDETRGHADNLACFTASDRVLALDPATARDVDRDVLWRNLTRLQDFRTAQGHALHFDLLPLPAPKRRHDGSWLTRNYINFYVTNAGVIVPVFDDPADADAAAIIGAHFPDRHLVGIPANPILEGGGGIHCITQQQPD